MKFLISLILLLVSLAAEARVEVAFIEAWTRAGKKVELEKGDRFAHVAIKYDGLWLHSSPTNGTELVADFQVFAKNRIAEILVDEQTDDLTPAEVAAVIGMPYDFKFRWSDDYGTYCSKLVAKFLIVNPQPMRFDGSYFAGIKNLPRGEPGVSPDGLYRKLIKRGYSVIIVKPRSVHGIQ
jgi:hypothetical protein